MKWNNAIQQRHNRWHRKPKNIGTTGWKGLFKNLAYFEWWFRTFDDVQLGIKPSHKIRVDFVSDCQDNLHVIVQLRCLTTVNGIQELFLVCLITVFHIFYIYIWYLNNLRVHPWENQAGGDFFTQLVGKVNQILHCASGQVGAILSTELGQYPVILTTHLVNKLYIKVTQAWLKWSADLCSMCQLH